MNGCHIKPEQFFNLIFGYFGSSWHYDETTNWAAGYNNASGWVCPAGEVRIILAAHIRNISRGCSCAISVKNAAGQAIALKTGATTVAGEAFAWSGQVLLKEGDYIFYEVSGCQAGDDGNWGSLGYRMKLSQ